MEQNIELLEGGIRQERFEASWAPKAVFMVTDNRKVTRKITAVTLLPYGKLCVHPQFRALETSSLSQVVFRVRPLEGN